jgi:glucan 1,3-beta-glucosidase
VRAASGTGQNNGPYISMHEGFMGLTKWANYLPGADRIALDTHPYLCFGPQSAATMDTYANTPCTAWGAEMNTSMAAFGLTAAGEWSNAVTDCGLWVNGVNLGTRYEGNYTGSTTRIGSCEPWNDWQSYSTAMKSQLKTFAEASMDALHVCILVQIEPLMADVFHRQNWFFWTWKIGNSTVYGKVMAPEWSYQLGLQEGWMPTDPRSAMGACKNANPFSGPLSAWQTGGTGAGQIPVSVTASYAWPPTSISNAGAVTLLPSYTPTGTVPTLSAPTFTGTGSSSGSLTSAGNGWQNPSDTAGAMVAIASCSYLDPWIGSANPPSPLCSGAKRDVPEPVITPPPSA